MEPVVQNVVMTANLGCKLDLRAITSKCWNIEYNPATMRIRKPKSTALIFNSGKIVCTGTKSKIDAKIAVLKFCKLIKRAGFDVKEPRELEIQNVVGSGKVDFQIALDKLWSKNRVNCTYEPELFPGLKYQMSEPKPKKQCRLLAQETKIFVSFSMSVSSIQIYGTRGCLIEAKKKNF